MHDTDANPSSLQQSALREQSVTGLHCPPAKQAAQPSPARGEARKPGLIQRLMQFFARMLRRKPPVRKESAADLLLAADRAATALAAQLPPPLAFKGNTANTLATPMGAYAGKPVEQAMRKRAEQQFKNMDVTRTTMN